jgi:flagellar hook-length control protein FliK
MSFDRRFRGDAKAMQIQDERRRTDSPPDIRFRTEDRFAAVKPKPIASSSDDVFAEIFAAIAATQSPAPFPWPEIPKTKSDSLDEAPEASAAEDVAETESNEEESPEELAVLEAVPLVPQAVVEAKPAELEAAEGEQLQEPVQAADFAQQTPIAPEGNLATSEESTGSQPVLGSVQPSDSLEVELKSDKRQKSNGETSASTIVDASEPTAAAATKNVAETRGAQAEPVALPAASEPDSQSSRDRQGRRGRQGNSDAREKSAEQKGVNGSPANSHVTRQEVAASAAGKPAALETIPTTENSSPGAASVIAPPAAVTTPTASSHGAAVASAASQAASPKSGSNGTTSSPGSVVMGSQATPGTQAAPDAALTETPANRRAEIADRARLVHRIAKAFQRLSMDGGQVRLKMHPEELGGVQLNMQITGRKVSATVVAESEAASQLLQDSLPELRQRLESQGLVVEKLEVAQRSDSENPGFGNQNSGQFGEKSAPRDDIWRRPREPQPAKPLAVPSRPGLLPSLTPSSSQGIDLKV